MNAETTWIPKQWTFDDASVAARFDRHVREQLPWYDHVLGCIEHFGAHYIQERGVVYDVGASTGNVGRKLAPYVRDRGARLIAIEKSPQMAKLWKHPEELDLDRAKILMRDVRDVEFEPCDFIVVNLVLMFLPTPDRYHLVDRMHASLREGGALVVVDKVEPPVGYLGTVFHRLAMRWKLEAGAEASEIIANELSLGGVQRPLDPSVVMKHSGVKFFQFGEFAGWIVEKGTDLSDL